MADIDFDLAVVGGGINGVGIAADAAGRGLNVVLLEAGDLASGTSSASSKLAHGGLRYLEQGAVRLVREALQERDSLLTRAPHLCTPLRFCLPLDAALRPAWQVRIGLWLYDHLAGAGPLPPSATVTLDAGGPLQPQFTEAFEYSDGWIDDARLVIAVAQQAAQHGAIIRSRCPVVAAQRHASHWQLDLAPVYGGPNRLSCTALVNATGPAANQFLATVTGNHQPRPLRQIRGSHIVVPRLTDDERAFILQAQDKRVVFVLPYGLFHLVGTTEVEETASGGRPQASDEEVDYLCQVVSRWWRQPVLPSQVVQRFAGIRPLADDGSGNPRTASRDYRLLFDHSGHQAALLSVFGGKLTTYRALAERAVNRLAPLFSHINQPWTADQPLPGGEISDLSWLLRMTRQRAPYLPEASVKRLVHSYGSQLALWLTAGDNWQALGGRIAADVSQAELQYLVEHEWLRSSDDLLWRRSKLGLTTTLTEQQLLGKSLELLLQPLHQPAMA
ncbi:MAG: glycerol-3-phosphate dehydrogenase [Gammaproteobacteria bacterium]|nr:glycerol-3-phosphate dehydrogenase [Gammaproteobacteria bacterium]